MCRVASCFNHVIELNQKMLKLLEYLLFTKKLFVIKYYFVFIVLGSDTSSLCSREYQHRCIHISVRGRNSSGKSGNSTLSETKTINYEILQVTHHFTPETENVELYDATKFFI